MDELKVSPASEVTGNKPPRMRVLDQVKKDAERLYNKRVRDAQEEEDYKAQEEGREPRQIIPPVILPDKPYNHEEFLREQAEAAAQPLPRAPRTKAAE